ncbi:UvrD-helicase domain-containing protein [Pseudomonas koreensis]|uniref:UvrD-helicase domain-containing protein n=1 Tax=Pseudomonas koreensis TaxID=198620 RepID=UPI0021C5D6EA|nr:UvrD-helicase domain-containing protein [Pseudomonas koreensis]MCU0091398.1 UvrD-helicase domain-containing protein [Pseudomonas koreensis]
MPPEIDLLAVERGSVTAPAGCGKTQQIAEALGAHTDSKPILVLTHTNAGVAALRARLAEASISRSAYRLATIDGFAMRLVAKFPQRSGLPPAMLELANPGDDYPAIRAAAARLLQAGHITQSLRASYARLLVDEYQDCNIPQHTMITWAAQVLPTCVLGDPMQAIFNFPGNALVNWQTDVEPHFPSAGMLQTPWRWQRAGTAALGQWLLAVRARLQAGQSVDLRTAPAEVQWIQLQAATEDTQRRQAAMVRINGVQDSVLVIGDARRPGRRHDFASQTPGTTVVERVDLPELIQFARSFKPTAADPLAVIIGFAASVMTGVGAAALLERVRILRFGRPHVPPTPIEAAAVSFANAPSLIEAQRLLLALSGATYTRVYRPELLNSCHATLQAANGNPAGLYAAALQVRERQRHTGRTQSRRRVGSTLLLKGLEADVAVILEPHEMTAQHLYVAMTRGARQLIVCSSTSVLTPIR